MQSADQDMSPELSLRQLAGQASLAGLSENSFQKLTWNESEALLKNPEFIRKAKEYFIALVNACHTRLSTPSPPPIRPLRMMTSFCILTHTRKMLNGPPTEPLKEALYLCALEFAMAQDAITCSLCAPGATFDGNITDETAKDYLEKIQDLLHAFDAWQEIDVPCYISKLEQGIERCAQQFVFLTPETPGHNEILKMGRWYDERLVCMGRASTWQTLVDRFSAERRCTTHAWMFDA